MKYDLIIIGGGPAGAAAGVYAARKGLKAMLITDSFGGQSVASGRIENWIGERALGGAELAIKFEDHLRAQAGLEIKEPERAAAVRKTDGGFMVATDKSGEYESRALIIASGGRHRSLNVPGGSDFDGRGVAYCSTCDAPVFRGKDVAIIGSGNAGLEAALDLKDYASKIYILDITDKPTGDKRTAEAAFKLPQLEFLPGVEVAALKGDSWLKVLEYKEKATGDMKELKVEGVFVAIGSVPNSEIVRGLADINPRGEIIVSRPGYATTCPGIFAAGDVTDDPYRQNNIAAGDAIKALLSACAYLQNKE